jgi:hypothetical protein
MIDGVLWQETCASVYDHELRCTNEMLYAIEDDVFLV